MRHLVDITDTPEHFFRILPTDWQEAIVPFWMDFADHVHIYVLMQDHEIVAGGIVFRKTPPDMEHFRSEAKRWFRNGYRYIGFIWVPENKRNQNFGSAWLQELKKTEPGRGFWLTTEEKGLAGFYLKNNFKKIKTLRFGPIEEDLFSYTPDY